MKKVTLFAVVAMAVLSLASCKKDRVCTCTSTVVSGSYSSSSTSTVTYTKAKKGDARKECLNSVATGTSGGTAWTDTRSCTLK